MAELATLISALLEGKHPGDGAYTAALLDAAPRAGILSAGEADAFQQDLLALVKQHAVHASHGDSSSLPAEWVEELCGQVGYCIDYALQDAPSPEQAVQQLREQGAKGLYESGHALLEQHFKACRSLLSRVRATRTRTVNQGYQVTLDRTLPLFLRQWEAADFPYDFPVITEYPLAEHPMESGIAGLHAYLANLALENRFCGRFQAALSQLLACHAHQNRTSPEEDYVNLFTLVLHNLLLCKILGQNTPENLTLSEQAFAQLQERFEGSHDKLDAALQDARDAIFNDLQFSYPALEEYIARAVERFSAHLAHTGVQARGIAVIEPAQELFLRDGARLDPDAFREVVQEVLLCETGTEKARIIQQKLRSLSDLFDLMESGCIFEEEYLELFPLLGDVACALLLSRLTVEQEDGWIDLGGAGEWADYFSDYLNALPADQQEKLLAFAEHLSQEE